MRAMYAGVAGLKTHQTKMDVIGNNIANVNTVAFKSSSTTFSEIMYQNVSGASGPSAVTGRGGVNAKQIGLGVTTGSTTVNISSPGSSQTTGDAFDLMITGDSFFVVNNGASNLFTKAGAFYIDGAGNLAMKSTGYNVMGWQVDPATGDIRKDTVSPLRIMTESNLTSPPEATTRGTCAGVLDKNSTSVNSDAGYAMALNFKDALGYTYTAKFAVRSTDVKGEYTVELEDILDVNGKSIVDNYNATELADIVKFGQQNTQSVTERMEPLSGVTYDATQQKFFKTAEFPDNVTDYETAKVPGFTYQYDPANGVNNGTITTQATLGDAGGMTRDQLEKTYGVVYVTQSIPGEPQTPPYYYKYDHSGVGTAGKVISTPEDWMEVLGIENNTNINNFQVTQVGNDGTMNFTFDQEFTLVDSAVLDPTTNTFTIEVSREEAYGLDTTDSSKRYGIDVAPDGVAQVTTTTILSANILKFNVDDGLFTSINGSDTVTLDFATSVTDRQGNNWSLQSFSDIEIDFTTTKWYENGGSSTMGMDPGAIDGETGKGKALGDLIGLSVSNDGTIWGSYDNGNTVLLGQIAVAVFANPSGLEKVGENCYQTTLNSGEFDGIGQDITADGGKMSSGQLEMSNVDLSTEFTEMITTQRGFQANSRIITTSDTLLEELINLKR